MSPHLSPFSLPRTDLQIRTVYKFYSFIQYTTGKNFQWQNQIASAGDGKQPFACLKQISEG
jgi:hypothetical protein